jgi:hypothetical protein
VYDPASFPEEIWALILELRATSRAVEAAAGRDDSASGETASDLAF